MSDLADELFTLMGNTTGVTDIVSHRFYSVRARQGTPPPYIVVTMPANTGVTHLRGQTDLENDIVRFDMFGKDRSELRRLRKAIKDMMNGGSLTFQSIYRFGTEIPEDDTQMHHLVADFSVWHDMM